MRTKSTEVWKRLGLGVVAAGGAAAAARSLRHRAGDALWQYGVLINLDESKLCPRGEHLTPPLDRLAEHAEVQLRRAPGGRGTQVLAIAREPGVDVRQELREAKQLLETGEVLRMEAWPAARGSLAQRATRVLDRFLVRGGWR